MLASFEQLVLSLKDKGVQFDSGLTGEEVGGAEKQFDIILPPDLRTFLQTALPISDGFVNWRAAIRSSNAQNVVNDTINSPLRGILFDVENNAFWWDSWGPIPDSASEREKIVIESYQQYPKLIPIYGHRFIPETPWEAGNPVFSVHQTDVIHYGYDLSNYFANEFFGSSLERFDISSAPVKRIDFWTDLAMF